jgi:hypothetical protein
MTALCHQIDDLCGEASKERRQHRSLFDDTVAINVQKLQQLQTKVFCLIVWYYQLNMEDENIYCLLIAFYLSLIIKYMSGTLLLVNNNNVRTAAATTWRTKDEEVFCCYLLRAL